MPRTCHAKATGRAAETKGRQGVHPTPCRAPSAAPATQKPQAYIRPLAEHQEPRLPRRAEAETKGRQGVHPTPCRASSAAPATQKPPAERRRPLEHQVPHLPCKSHRQSGVDQGTPGRTSDPWSTKCRTCHAKATGRAAETKGRQGVHPTPCSAAPATQKPPAERRRPRDARVHPTPCRAPSAAPATQKPPAERRRPRDARAYIRPLTLQSTKCRACHAKATGRAAETKGREGVHPTPCRAPSAAPATQKPPAERRRPRDVHPTPAERRRPRDCRTYIRPLAEHQVPHLPRKSHRRPRDARAYIRPLAEPRKRVSEWVREWVSEWVGGWVSEWVSVWVCDVCVRVMCWCVSEWVFVCVRGGAGGAKERADTELKTKNHTSMWEKAMRYIYIYIYIYIWYSINLNI